MPEVAAIAGGAYQWETSGWLNGPGKLQQLDDGGARYVK